MGELMRQKEQIQFLLNELKNTDDLSAGLVLFLFVFGFLVCLCLSLISFHLLVYYIDNELNNNSNKNSSIVMNDGQETIKFEVIDNGNGSNVPVMSNVNSFNQNDNVINSRRSITENNYNTNYTTNIYNNNLSTNSIITSVNNTIGSNGNVIGVDVIDQDSVAMDGNEIRRRDKTRKHGKERRKNKNNGSTEFNATCINNYIDTLGYGIKTKMMKRITVLILHCIQSQRIGLNENPDVIYGASLKIADRICRENTDLKTIASVVKVDKLRIKTICKEFLNNSKAKEKANQLKNLLKEKYITNNTKKCETNNNTNNLTNKQIQEIEQKIETLKYKIRVCGDKRSQFHSDRQRQKVGIEERKYEEEIRQLQNDKYGDEPYLRPVKIEYDDEDDDDDDDV